MERPPQTRYPLHDLLRRRWSPLAFHDRPVAPELLGSLLEAARWSASSYNEQPWNIILATREEPEEFERLAACLVEGNQVWARRAPVLLLSVAKLRFDRDGRENTHASYDVGQAMAYLTVQATALGLFVHQMAGFRPDQARETYGIPPTHAPVSAAAVGYYGRPERLPEDLQQRERSPRQRKSLESFAFTGQWGRPAGFLQR